MISNIHGVPFTLKKAGAVSSPRKNVGGSSYNDN